MISFGDVRLSGSSRQTTPTRLLERKQLVAFPKRRATSSYSGHSAIHDELRTTQHSTVDLGIKPDCLRDRGGTPRNCYIQSLLQNHHNTLRASDRIPADCPARELGIRSFDDAQRYVRTYLPWIAMGRVSKGSGLECQGGKSRVWWC